MNVFTRLQRLLPPSPVWIGEVLEHHADDTSTVELPAGLGAAPIAGGLAAGSRIRVRGTTVPVGSRAFIRDGVIETQAPDGDVVELVVGTVVSPPSPLAFSGPVPNLTKTVGDSVSLALSGYFSGGVAPYSYAVTGGTLPGGLTLNTLTGVISGVVAAAVVAAGLVITATDRDGATAATGAFTITVEAAPPSAVVVYEDNFNGTGTLETHTADTGQTYDWVYSYGPDQITLGSGLATLGNDWGARVTPDIVPAAACRLAVVFKTPGSASQLKFNLRDGWGTYIELDSTTVYVGDAYLGHTFARDAGTHTLVIEHDGVGNRSMWVDSVLVSSASSTTDSDPTAWFGWYGSYTGLVLDKITLENL